MHRAYSRAVLHRDQWALIELEKLLLLLFAHMGQRKAPLDSRVVCAREFLHANFARPLKVGDVARASLLSVSQLSFLFSQQIGIAPMRYLERLRLERARELLAFTPASLREIAARAGYTDAEYFARRFRLHSGQTPRAFRKNSA